MRIYELARELNITSKEIIHALNEKNVTGKTATSSISGSDEAYIRKKYTKESRKKSVQVEKTNQKKSKGSSPKPHKDIDPKKNIEAGVKKIKDGSMAAKEKLQEFTRNLQDKQTAIKNPLQSISFPQSIKNIGKKKSVAEKADEEGIDVLEPEIIEEELIIDEPAPEPVVPKTFIDDAETASQIVTTSIQNGEIEDLGAKLSSISSEDGLREQYVFPRASHWRWLTLCLITVVLSVAFVYFIIVSAGTIAFSTSYRLYGLIGLLISILVLLFNAMTFRFSIMEIMFGRRFDKYYSILKYKNIEIVDDLISMANSDRSIVERDLNKAVKRKLIPEGHFGRQNIIFMVSDAVYNRYSEKMAVYDRYYKKLIEERSRMNHRDRETEELLQQGQEYITKIHDSNDIIKDKDISQKLSRMEEIVTAIFHEVDINPAQANKLGVFMGYYLPTTEKLLETYIENDEKTVKGKSIEYSQKKIADALDSINDAFESLLERFYKEQELDIESDISAMQIIMQQEGLQGNQDE